MIAELRGRNALVTGAAGGLGGYIAMALADQGLNLALSDLPGTSLDELGDQLGARGVEVKQVPFDLTDTAGLTGLVEAAESAVGELDVLVNNAGIEFGGPFERHTASELEMITRVNLLATMELTRAVLPGMVARRRGHIVNLASMAGKAPFPYLSSYCATKFGVVGFTQALQAEYHDSPVGFSVICPGFIGRVGMYGRHEETGLRPPPLMGTLPPEAVGDAVVKAIRSGRPEVCVNKGPSWPLPMLSACAPRAGVWAVSRRPLRAFAEQFFRATGRM